MTSVWFVKLLSLQATALLLLAGCAAANKCPPLEPGMAGIEIRAVAEPKQGVSPADNPDSYGASGPAGRLQPLDYENFPGIVVWVEPTSASAGSSAVDSATSTTIAFDDRGAVGGSVARGVPVGSKLVIENHGEQPQSIYSVSDGNEFDLHMVAPGQQAEYVVRSPGEIEVLSETMPDPIALVYSAPTRWVKTLGSGESTCFSDLPPGEYRVVCWNDRLPGSKQPVTLTAGTRTQVTVKASVNVLPPHP